MKKEQKEFKVTPWEVSGDIDYNKLIKEFGLSPMKDLPDIFNKNLLFRRKIVFAHRDIQRILEAIKNKKPFAMMTGGTIGLATTRAVSDVPTQPFTSTTCA